MTKCYKPKCTRLAVNKGNRETYCLAHIPLDSRDNLLSGRHEHVVLNSLLKNLEISDSKNFSNYRISHDVALGKTGIRPDLLINSNGNFVVVEVDEKQHSTPKNIIDDKKRESNIRDRFNLLDIPVDIVRIIPGEDSSIGITEKVGIIYNKSGYNNALNKLTKHVSKSLNNPSGISTRVSYTGNLVSPGWKSIIDDPFSPELSNFKSNEDLDLYLSILNKNSKDKKNHGKKLKSPSVLNLITSNLNEISHGEETSPRTSVVNYIRKMARDSDQYTGSQRFQTTKKGDNRYLVLGGKDNVTGIEVGYDDETKTNSVRDSNYTNYITNRYLTNTGFGISKTITKPIRLTVSRRQYQTSPVSMYTRSNTLPNKTNRKKSSKK
jgi:hypothetical protein